MGKKQEGGVLVKCVRKGMLVLCLLCVVSVASLALPAAAGRTLRIGVDCNLPPYQFLDEHGRCVGMHAEMLSAIVESMGFSPVYVPLRSNRACMEALYLDDVDVVMGVITNSLSDAGIAYSDPLSTATLCVVSATEFRPERVNSAVFSEDTTRNTLLSNLGFAEYIVVDNQKQVFERQQKLGIPSIIGLRESLVYQIREVGMEENYTISNDYLDSVSFALVVQKSNRDLLRELNAGIAQFKTSAPYLALYDSWIQRDDSAHMRALFHRLLTLCILGGSAALCYGWFAARMRRVLQRQVAGQTREIQASKVELERQLSQVQSENDLRNRIIKYSPSAIILFDAAYTVSMLNKSARVMAALSAGAALPNALELPVFREILQETGQSIFEAGALIENRSLQLHDPRDYRSYRYTMHQIVQYGEITHILLSVQDVTQEDKAKQEAFEKEKSQTLNRVVAGIAHEIRNPLMSISTFATLVGSDGESKEVQASFAEYVPQEIQRIDRLIESLIHYAKPSRRISRRIEVASLLEELHSLLAPAMKKARVDFRRSCDPALFFVADRDQMKQVLINLLMNGMEAIESRRRREPALPPAFLTVDAFFAEGDVLLRIRDEGVGMLPQELEECMEPFFTTKDSGTGLGLALCKHYVLENGGAIFVESTQMHHTEITLRFPAAPEEALLLPLRDEKTEGGLT